MLFFYAFSYTYIGDNMLNSLNNFINDNTFRFTVYENMINIINYNKIISLEDNYISILSTNKKILIKGNNLILKKLLDKEILIKGNISNIEVINE